MIGHWKNFEELEENLCLAELYRLLEASREQKHQDRKFAAALKGVDLDKEALESDTSFEDVKKRVEARLSGMTEEQYEMTQIGISMVDDE